MESVNRFAVRVTPRQPYLEWARSIDAGAALLDITPEQFTSIYLVDSREMFEPDRVMRKHYALIFEEQLHAWHRDPARWPARRTQAMFEEWFESTVIETVWDLGRREIYDD